jgi:hypothetical protein
LRKKYYALRINVGAGRVAQVVERLASKEAQYCQKKKKKEYRNVGRCWWLTPIILATQEAQIRRITVESQPGLIVLS